MIFRLCQCEYTKRPFYIVIAITYESDLIFDSNFYALYYQTQSKIGQAEFFAKKNQFFSKSVYMENSLHNCQQIWRPQTDEQLY